MLWPGCDVVCRATARGAACKLFDTQRHLHTMSRVPRDEAARRAMAIALRTATPVLGRQEAAEIAQDVGLDVLRSLDRLREPAAFDAWVHKIAVRHTAAAFRRQRVRAVEEPLGLERHDITDQADRDLLIAARAALADALASLPPRQALALVLRYVHDLTDREIAAALGCRRGTVNALLSRARARLRDVPELEALATNMEMVR
jgi:RNA polymerase sigma factor (sigma-70 family)